VLGGFDRQQNYDALIALINNNKKIDVFLLGSTGMSIKDRIDNCTFFDDFNSLVAEITKNIKNSTAVLLSPASASFDMFKNYKERGSLFKELVLGSVKRSKPIPTEVV
jgi:UDP-N-acetylmuramoylalanine--D-glutamate ligase